VAKRARVSRSSTVVPERAAARSCTVASTAATVAGTAFAFAWSSAAPAAFTSASKRAGS